MKMSEIEVNLDYQVKKTRKSDPWFLDHARYTGRIIVLGKIYRGMKVEVEKGRTRPIPVAMEYVGYDTKKFAAREAVWGQYDADGRQVYKEVAREMVDYQSKSTTRWQFVELPISRIVRPWDEYLEEKELDEEMERQQREHAEAIAAKEREERERARKEKEEQGRQKVEKVKTWFDENFPGHGVEFVPSTRYGSDNIIVNVYGEFRNFDWWERFVDAMQKNQ